MSQFRVKEDIGCSFQILNAGDGKRCCLWGFSPDPLPRRGGGGRLQYENARMCVLGI